MGRGAGKERTKGKRTGVCTIVVNTRTSHPLHTATKLEVSLNEAGPAVSTVREVRTTSCCTLPFREQKRYIMTHEHAHFMEYLHTLHFTQLLIFNLQNSSQYSTG